MNKQINKYAIDPADVLWLEELLDQVYRSLAK